MISLGQWNPILISIFLILQYIHEKFICIKIEVNVKLSWEFNFSEFIVHILHSFATLIILQDVLS